MAKCGSRNDTACGFGDITEEAVLDSDPPAIKKPKEKTIIKQDKPKTRDIVREYVLQEETRMMKRKSSKSKLPIKLKDLKPASVVKNRAKMNKKPTKAKSTENLFDKYRKKSTENLLERYSTRKDHSQSVSRLPTLTAFDEERIIWMKSYEDDIALERERRARTALSRQAAVLEQSASSAEQSDQSSSPSSASTCISRGTSPYVRLQQKRKEQLDRLQHELSVTQPQPPIFFPGLPVNIMEDENEAVVQDDNIAADKHLSSGPSMEEDSGNVDPTYSLASTLPMSQDSLEMPLESPPKSLMNQEAIEETSKPVEAEDGTKEVKEETNASSSNEESKKRLRRSMKKKDREAAEDRRRSRSRKKTSAQPLSAECFLVSRGWQLDQTRLLRSLDRIQRAHFGRVQLATTINRVVESIRPHLDTVIIHIGNQELIEAAHSVVTVTENGENVRDSAAIGLSVAGSVASVLSRHIITAANQNRGTQFIISLPLPVSLIKTSVEADIHYTELRRMFNATMKANCATFSNIQCCDNENLSGSTKVGAISAGNDVPPNSPPTNDNSPPAAAADNNNTKATEDGKYILENHQVTTAGMRKLCRNWESCIGKIFRAPDGELLVRRSSESSGITTGSGSDTQLSKRPSISKSSENKSSNSESSPSDSLEQRAPWKPC